MNMIARVSILVIALTLAVPATGAAKQRRGSTPDGDAATAARVKEEFLHAWRDYERYAWGHDALKPLSKGAESRAAQCAVSTRRLHGAMHCDVSRAETAPIFPPCGNDRFPVGRSGRGDVSS